MQFIDSRLVHYEYFSKNYVLWLLASNEMICHLINIQ